MKLPDFSKHEGFNQLKKDMGVVEEVELEMDKVMETAANSPTTLVNLTMEKLIIRGVWDIRLEPSGTVAWVGTAPTHKLDLGVEVRKSTIHNLPEPENNIIYIVTPYVAAMAGRDDVLAPDMITTTNNEWGDEVITNLIQY